MSHSLVAFRWRPMLALPFLLWATIANALTYNEVLDLAETRASELKARQNSVAAARASQISAGELPDPKLVMGVDNVPIQGSEAWNTTRDFMSMQRVGVMQEVTNGEKREAARRLAEANVAKADQELAFERLNVRRQALLSWLKVYYAEQRRALLEKLGSENRLQAIASGSRLAAAQGKAGESLQVRMDAATLADRQDGLMRDIAAARAELARWVGPAAHEPLTGDPPVYVPNSEHLRHDLEHHPDIAVYKAQEASAEAEVAMAEAAKKSDWGVEVDYQHRGPAFGDMVSVQFTFDLPVFTHTRQNPQIAARRQELERVSAERETMIRQHTVELERLLAEQTALTRQIERVDKEWLPLNQEKLELALAGYKTGNEPLTAVLDARRDLLDSRIKCIDLEEQRSVAETNLRYLSEENQP